MGKIRVRHGDNEIEIDGSDAFIKKHLQDFYERIQYAQLASPSASLKKEIEASAAKKPSTKQPTPAEFYKSKNRTDGTSQILIFGKYLEDYKGKSEFTRQDINDIAKDAKIAKDIHSQYFTNAVKQGLLRNVGYGKYSLSISAEEVLSAMG
jgi:hypothetical protein